MKTNDAFQHVAYKTALYSFQSTPHLISAANAATPTTGLDYRERGRKTASSARKQWISRK